MSTTDFKTTIVEIVSKYLENNNNFKLFVFGYHGINTDLIGNGIDIGINAGTVLDYDTIVKIQNDLYGIPSDQKIYLIDFMRISSEMRNWAENTAVKVN